MQLNCSRYKNVFPKHSRGNPSDNFRLTFRLAIKIYYTDGTCNQSSAPSRARADIQSHDLLDIMTTRPRDDEPQPYLSCLHCFSCWRRYGRLQKFKVFNTHIERCLPGDKVVLITFTASHS